MTTRLLPRFGTSEDDLAELLASRGWQKHASYPAGEAGPAQEVWLTDDGSTAIHWVKDDVLLLEYVSVVGFDEEEVAEFVRVKLPCHTLKEVRALAQTDLPWQDQVPVLYKVAVGAPATFDPIIFGLFASCAKHEHRHVRHAVYVSIPYVGWSELRPLLVTGAASDPDSDLRDFATTVLAVGNSDDASRRSG